MRVSSGTPGRRFLLLIAGAFLIGLGGLLLSLRPGLKREYFASPAGTETVAVFRDIAMPRLESRDEVAEVLVSQEIFHLRWTGWLSIDRAGEYRFFLRADEASYLKLDQKLFSATDRGSRSARSERVYLAAGLHPIEVGLSQTGGRAYLDLKWSAGGKEPELLSGSGLVARRPARMRAALQGWLSPSGSRLVSRAIGWLTVLTGVMIISLSLLRIWPEVKRALASIGRGGAQSPKSRRWMRALFLLGLFLVVFSAALPYTASTTDGDDVRYMDGARFNKQMGWNMNRYAHIYALKAFIWAADGDAFQASRVYWAVSFGLIAVSLAIAVQSLGPGLQLVSLAVAIFLLLAQPYVFGGIGAAYADYSAMMFVALGLAVYLHGYKTQEQSSSRWHAAALGVLTVAAAKSKEPGLIMLWLALALVWSNGRLDLRRFARRMVWWVMGAMGAYLVLMTLDALILGDFWFSLRLESVAGAQRLKDAAEGIWQLSRWAWLSVAFTPGPLRILSALAVVVVVVALIRPWPAELRWIAFMPFAFMAMMIAVHPAISSPRYLFPIVPVVCFAGAMTVRDLVSGSGSGGGYRWVRGAGLTVCLLAFFGTGFLDTWDALERHRTAQRGTWTLYPWEVFQEEIENLRPKEISVSPRLYRTYQMMGKSKTRDRIARLFFQRRFLKLRERRDLGRLDKVAILTRKEFRQLLEVQPDVEERAVLDPSGEIVLVTPKLSGTTSR